MPPVSSFRLDGFDRSEARRRLEGRSVERPVEPTGPSPNSPCVRNCCLDEQDMCLGCGRLLKEICGWHAATQSEREEILRLSRMRLTDRPSQSGAPGW